MFEALEPLPPDSILGLMADFRADPRPEKIDLGVGVYKDENGATPVLEAVKQALEELRPDVLIAGPAFDASRYGLACGAVCQAAQEMSISSVCAMHPENPGVMTFRSSVYIVPTGVSPAEMQQVLANVHALAMKLAAGAELGTPEAEGYLPQGTR